MRWRTRSRAGGPAAALIWTPLTLGLAVSIALGPRAGLDIDANDEAAFARGRANAGFDPAWSLPAHPARRTRAGRVKFADLSGRWSGEYRYDDAMDPPVPFNATLVEEHGVLTGATEEPNTFGDPSAAHLSAVLEGMRSGAHVHFVKRYDGSGGQRHAVLYDGALDAQCLRIDGRWKAGFAAGDFFMTRETMSVAAEETRHAHAARATEA